MTEEIKPGDVVIWHDSWRHDCAVVTKVTEKVVMCGRRYINKLFDRPRRSQHSLERTQELLRAAYDIRTNAERQIQQQYEDRITRIVEGGEQ